MGNTQGGALLPGGDYDITGAWTYPAGTAAGSPVTVGGTQTLTNKTLTAPAITAAALSGATTIATGATITGPTITGATSSGSISADYKALAAPATFTSNVTPATLTGFSWTVVAGTYIFELNLPATMTTNGGLTVDFLLTTAVLTSIQYQSYAATATDNGTAVSTQGTTTTSATKVFDSRTAAYTLVTIKGSMVVGTGGTFAWQACQNASHVDTTTVLLGAYARLQRIL